MREYRFRFQTNKGGGYLLAGLIGAPLLTLSASILLINSIDWIFWISIPLMIFLAIYFIRLYIKKSIANDIILTDKNGFTSEYYGRVQYADIHSIPPYGILQAPPPSMRIRLYNGKKLVWILDANNSKRQQDAAIFSKFRDELLNRLKLLHRTLPTAGPTTSQSISGDAASQDADDATYKQVISQLEKHQKRDIQFKYIAIPVSAAMALLLFIRTCGEDFIKHKQKKEMDNIRAGLKIIEDKYQKNIVHSKQAIAKYTAQFGPVFLWTNDPNAGFEFLPDLENELSTSGTPVIGVTIIEQNKAIEKVIAHPEKFKYQKILFNTSNKMIIPLQSSVFAQKEDSSTAYLYFAVYNADTSLQKGTNTNGEGFRPISFCSSAQFPKEHPVKKEYFKSMDFASARAIMVQYPESFFYIVAIEKSGISFENFQSALDIVKNDFKNYHIHTEDFYIKIVNK